MGRIPNSSKWHERMRTCSKAEGGQPKLTGRVNVQESRVKHCTQGRSKAFSIPGGHPHYKVGGCYYIILCLHHIEETDTALPSGLLSLLLLLLILPALLLFHLLLHLLLLPHVALTEPPIVTLPHPSWFLEPLHKAVIQSEGLRAQMLHLFSDLSGFNVQPMGQWRNGFDVRCECSACASKNSSCSFTCSQAVWTPKNKISRAKTGKPAFPLDNRPSELRVYEGHQRLQINIQSKWLLSLVRIAGGPQTWAGCSQNLIWLGNMEYEWWSKG